MTDDVEKKVLSTKHLNKLSTKSKNAISHQLFGKNCTNASGKNPFSNKIAGDDQNSDKFKKCVLFFSVKFALFDNQWHLLGVKLKNFFIKKTNLMNDI